MRGLMPQLDSWAQPSDGGAGEGGRGEAGGPGFSRSPDPPECLSAAVFPAPARDCLSLPAQSAWESWLKVRQASRDRSPWSHPPRQEHPGTLETKSSSQVDPVILYLKTFNGSHRPWDKIPNPDRGPQAVWFSPRLALWALPLPFLPLWTIFSVSLNSSLTQGSRTCCSPHAVPLISGLANSPSLVRSQLRGSRQWGSWSDGDAGMAMFLSNPL